MCQNQSNVKYLFKSIWTQLSDAFSPDDFRLLNEQFGLNVASSMAMVESKLLHVKRISESWHPHSSTTSANGNYVNVDCNHRRPPIIMEMNERLWLSMFDQWKWGNWNGRSSKWMWFSVWFSKGTFKFDPSSGRNWINALESVQSIEFN